MKGIVFVILLTITAVIFLWSIGAFLTWAGKTDTSIPKQRRCFIVDYIDGKTQTECFWLQRGANGWVCTYRGSYELVAERINNIEGNTNITLRPSLIRFK